MFETTAVESKKKPLRRNRMIILPVSVAIHVVVVAGLLFAGVWSVEMPRQAPSQIAAFVVDAPPPLPPGGGGSTRPKKAAQAEKPAVIPKDAAPRLDTPQEMTPTQVPDGIPDVSADPGGAGEPGGEGIPGFDGNGSGFGVGPGEGIGAGEATEPGPLPVGGDVRAPQIVTRVEPRYPDLLVKLRARGVAVVECIVDRNGNVEQAEIVSASHPLFGASALDAVKRWKFRAGTLNGTAVKTIFRLTVTFSLNR